MKITVFLTAALLWFAAGAAFADWQPVGKYRVSAYCPCAVCCKKADGITADGTYAPGSKDRIVAAPKEFPFGTKLWIEGVGVVVVHDRGTAMRGHQLDLFFPKHKAALKWGVQQRAVFLWTDKSG